MNTLAILARNNGNSDDLPATGMGIISITSSDSEDSSSTGSWEESISASYGIRAICFEILFAHIFDKTIISQA